MNKRSKKLQENLENQLNKYYQLMLIPDTTLKNTLCSEYKGKFPRKLAFLSEVQGKIDNFRNEKTFCYVTHAKYLVFFDMMYEQVRARMLTKETYDYVVNTSYERIKKDLRKGKIPLDKQRIEEMVIDLKRLDIVKRMGDEGKSMFFN